MLMVAGAPTVMLAVAKLPVPPSVELMVPVVLTFEPSVVPCTVTANVQFVFTAMVPFANEMELPPFAAVTVPLQVLPVFGSGGFTTINPAGSVSVKAIPVCDTVLAAGFVMVKVSVVVAFRAMLPAPKALPSVGGATTVMFAVLLPAPVPPSTELTGPVLLG